MHKTLRTRRTTLLATVAAATTSSLLLSACGGGSGSGGDAKAFSLTINDDNHIVQQELTTLSKGSCAAQNKALPLKIQTLPIGNVDQKVQLLAGQNALPVQFAAGGTPQLTKTLDKAGQVLDLEKTLKDLGVWDDLQPAAIKTVENLYGKFNVMPYQFNIEGIWYNKKLFADQHVATPTTYDQLVAAAAKFKDAGVTPFAADGKDGWPLTRLISGYLYRELGPDALQSVADGKAKLTDPAYVKAAQAVADLGKAGYFGKGVGSIDYDTATQQFLTGKAAMFYMGSWALGDFNDRTKNKIGADNVGFMPFPTVAGGKGSADQIPANVGLPVAVSAKSYDTKVGDWLSCITKNYGAASLKDQGTVSGFKPNGDTGTLPPLTQTVQDTISKTTTSTLWFEALFNTKATETSQTNAAPLVTGSLSAKDFMQKVQTDLDNG
ncbi:ABC transporter substrate-binding protein [Streptomyces griseorubiginosus]|uniref:ABC transporter substrate-binding protein n=1 Tax=Streptomyces griseorubiginosus TaxID=67304 RepID=UPI002E81B0AF|nr:extracellular solute-binding protein [Streptomyces griseorubiginosus]WUB49120.1 extracellular solute-binding protein [Streptomyces griseorubiginosus]WUB57647.1 extracellular solute-binding protein [Streptomyces griseorubiginosus]